MSFTPYKIALIFFFVEILLGMIYLLQEPFLNWEDPREVRDFVSLYRWPVLYSLMAVYFLMFILFLNELKY